MTAGSSGHDCTCAIFRQLAGFDDHRCLHTVYIQSLAQAANAQLPTVFVSPNSVVQIRPSAAVNARPYAYWTSNTFVSASPLTGQLRCSHESHKTKCEHIEAVKSFMQYSDTADGIDDEQEEFAQVAATLTASIVRAY